MGTVHGPHYAAAAAAVVTFSAVDSFEAVAAVPILNVAFAVEAAAELAVETFFCSSFEEAFAAEMLAVVQLAAVLVHVEIVEVAFSLVEEIYG